MKTLKPFTFLSLLFTTLTTFSQTNAILNYIPKDAKLVMKINPASLGQKMKWDELVKYKMFEDLMQQASEGKEFLKDPTQTGIDLAKGLFLVIPSNPNNKKPGPILCGMLKDTSRFLTMVKKTSPGKQPIKIGNGKLVTDENTALAWNNEIFIFTGTSNRQKPSNQNVEAKTSGEVTATKQLTETCKIFLNKKQATLSDERFTSLLSEEGDIYLWINNTISTQPKKKGKAQDVIEMLNKNLMRSGDYSSMLIRFENGKVVSQSKRYVSASLDSIYKKYPAKNFDTELFKKLPAGQPIVLASFSFSPEMLNEVFTKAGADKYIDSVSKHKIKMADVVSAIKGDITLAGMKVYEFTEEDSVTQALNGMQVFLTGHINDKEKFKSLAGLAQKKNDDSLNRPASKMKPLLQSNDSIFVVSISQIAAQKFLETAGGNEEIEKMISPYKGHPSAFLLDLKTVFSFALQTFGRGKSQEDAKHASEVLGMFDKLVSYGGEYNNRAMSTTIELTMTNKDENSLKQFMNLLNLAYSMNPRPPRTHPQ